MSRVAVIGLGRMGLPICTRLLGAGHTVLAVDVHPGRRDLAVAAGALAPASAQRAAAEADVLMTVLPGAPELRALMLGPATGEGLLRHVGPDVMWIDMTSASPDLAVDLSSAAARHSVRWLGAPMGGGPEAARAGDLTFFVGGEADVLSACAPVLAPLAAPERILHLGEHPHGYLAKLVVNLLWFTQAIATGEALLLAQAGGLDLVRLQEVMMKGPAASAFIASSVPAVFDGDYRRTFGLDRCVEELASLTAMASEREVPFELSTLVTDLHRRALERFGPVDGELLGVAYLENLAGRRIRPSGSFPAEPLD
jgi:3-hydroxyisobutyrate dehydrogenase